MKYRLVCVIDKTCQNRNIEIEVCFETGAKNLSPFQRKVTLSELLRSEGLINGSLVQLLFQIGQDRQPFRLSFEQLSLSYVQNIVNDQKWVYIKSGGKNNTLKRITSLIPYLPPCINQHFKLGKLIGGELYVSNIRQWWYNINVKFRYENTTLLFPVTYTSVPFQTVNGEWSSRDFKEENNLLNILGDSLDYDRSILNLNEDSFDEIKSLFQSGWTLFVPKGPNIHVPVYLKNNKSGIEWFSTNLEVVEDNEGTSKILQAFLHNRNFIENKGDIQLFSKQTVRKLSPDKMSKELVPALNLDRIYTLPIQLTEKEKFDVCRLIQDRVKATLKPYQIDGVIWLKNMRKRKVGCMLADDMGLGKTLQVLAYFATMSPMKKYLVICPASLTSNWEIEIERFTPILSSQIDIASYETVRIQLEKFNCQNYDTVVVDEGQFVKNDNTQRHKAISELIRKYTIILSGTPIENSVHEIWSQFKLIIPETEELEKKLQSMMNIQENDKYWIELSKMFLSPFILRRTKKEVLSNLPDKHENNILIDLSAEERRIYQSIHHMFITAIESGVSGRINSIALEALLRLRQCCVSVNLVPKYLTNTGYVKSSKIDLSMNLIQDFIKEGHKTLVFSQFTTALEELRKNLSKVSIKSLFLSGSTRNRQALVDSFQLDSDEKVFLISLKAGGTGLNLTSADRIILLDDWWNPAVENQAFSRAHRIGQNRIVEIYRILCRNTVEEKILELHKNKKEISDLFNATGNKMSFAQIRKILG